MLQNVREFSVQILQESNERDHTLGKLDPSHQDSHVAILTMSRSSRQFSVCFDSNRKMAKPQFTYPLLIALLHPRRMRNGSGVESRGRQRA